MKKQLFFLVAVVIYSNAFSQKWEEMRNDPNANFYDIQNVFNEYWKDKPVSERTPAYNEFKRWEYFAEQRVFPSGDLSQLSLTAKNFKDFNDNTNSQQAKGGSGNLIASTTWTAMGPFGNLTYTAFPTYGCAGRLDFLRIDPSNTLTIYGGGPTSGLWKSTDAGTSWSNLTQFLPVPGCSDLAIDPTNSNNLFLATGDGNSQFSNSVGVLKSTDGGATWVSTGLTYTISNNRHIYRLQINPLNPQILIAATNNGVFRTTNGGNTWAPVLMANVRDIEFKPFGPNTVYAAGQAGFYKSINGGANFNLISAGIFTTGISGMAICTTNNDSNYVYAVASNTAGALAGFFRSTNSGNTFALQTTTNNILGASPTSTNGPSPYALSIVANPVAKNTVIVGGTYTWYTTTGGSGPWTSMINTGSAPYLHVSQHDMTYYPAGTGIYVANDGGLLLYTGPTTIKTSTMNIMQTLRMGLSSLTPNLWITGHQYNGSGIYNGSNYTFKVGNDGTDCFYDRTSDNNVFASFQNGNFYRSTNAGAGFSPITTGLTGQAGYVAPFKQDPVLPNTLYAGYTDMFTSVNQGTNWTPLAPITGTGTIIDFAISTSSNQVIYVLKPSGVFKTMNAGTTWTNVTGTIPIGASRPSAVTIDPTDANNAWVTLSGYNNGNKVYVTTNGGTSWTNVTGNLPNIPVNCIMYNVGTNDRIFIGMDAGVFYKDNSSGTWTLFNSALPNTPVYDLEVSPAAPTKIRAALWGRGVYEADLFLTPASNFSINAASQCAGDPILFLDKSTNSPTSWSWSVTPSGGVSINTATLQNPSITFPSAGTYTVSVMASNGGGPGTTYTQAVTVYSVPIITVANPTRTVCVGSSVSFLASGGSSYNWSNNGGTNPVAVFLPTVATTYTVWGGGPNNCFGTTTVSVVMDPCVGIQELGVQSSELGVYPNPNNGNFIIETPSETQIILYNTLGSVILTKKITSGKTAIDMSSFSNGVYYLKSLSGDKNTVVKIVKE